MDLIRIVICLGIVLGLPACRKKSESTAAEVREAGYEMSTEGWFQAIAADDVAVMKKMIKGGFDEKTLNAAGNGALHAAVAAGNEEAGEYLLNRGFSVDEAGAGGRTPLMVAVLEDKPKMVKWLLRQGADPTIKDADGFSPLMLAVTKGKATAVEELAPFNREDLDSALLLAALVGEAKAIDVLTNYGASVYSRMEDGRTPLMLAAENGHTEAAAILMDIGASRFATTDDGSTAQSLAVAAGHGDIAEMIASGFTGDVLALESDEDVVASLDEDFAEMDPFGGESQEGESEGSDELAMNEAGEEPSGEETFDTIEDDGGIVGDETVSRSPNETPRRVVSLDGAVVSNPSTTQRTQSPDEVTKPVAGQTGTPNRQQSPEDELVEVSERSNNASVPPLVMRVYRQRELPVEVKEISGGVATLNLAGAEPRQVKVRDGDKIPGSNLLVVRVFTRIEQGKLNNSQPMEVGVMEVQDTGSGQSREWLAGRSASAHDPVALVEDAVTGERYVAKPGQKFRSEDGREYVVSDVRPSQLVIENTTTGEVRTLRLAGPKG
ncbi:MAG: ankyrin repeat domain-containing protein [Luteolibacter sp.]